MVMFSNPFHLHSNFLELINCFANTSNVQFLEWLSQSPTDIESYIRPGCIILTVYLRLEKSMWEEVPSYMIAFDVLI